METHFYQKSNKKFFYIGKCKKIHRKKQKLGVILKSMPIFLNSLANSLLITDGSCEKIYSDKEFVILATAGRHKKINVTYTEHHHFQQSNWFCITDFNTKQMISIKSARDIQKNELLGMKLNRDEFYKN